MELTANLRQAISSYKGGDSQAFNTLYNESCKYVYTCIYKVMCGNDNAQDAINDIMQDTYVEISRYISKLEDEEKFLSWAGTIATRKCYAYLKKSNKYVLLNEEDTTFDSLADNDSIIPEEIMQDREKQRLLREIIDTQLTEMQKLCIIAYYYNEQKQSEIAKELDIPENTVKTNLSRAKAKIRDGVKDLEKNKGTKLYGIAPIMLLLFRQEVQAATVPKNITDSVLAATNNVIAAVGNQVSKGVAGNMAQASKGASAAVKVGKGVLATTKAKIIAGAAAVCLVGTPIAVTFLGEDDNSESNSQEISVPDGAGEFEGHYYYVYEFEDFTWEDAKKFCEEQGGYLATITSKEENDYVYGYIKESGFENAYIGLTDEKDEGVWEWVNGEEVDYVNWSKKEPNGENKEEDYAMFYYKMTNGNWNDGDFGQGKTKGKHKSFICEWGTYKKGNTIEFDFEKK